MTFKFNLQLFGEGLSIPGIDEDILKELQAEGKKDTLKALAQYQPVS